MNRWKKVFGEYPLLVLILLTAAYFYRPLFMKEAFFYRDLSFHVLISRQIWSESIRQGEMPLWDPYLNSGRPFLANANNMALYPTSLLYLCLPAHKALTYEIVIHFILCGTGAYLLSRSIGFGKLAAFGASSFYTFSGLSLSMANLLNELIAFSYMPILLLFWHLYLKQPKLRWLAAIIFAGALQIFAGYPEITVISFTLLLLWAVANRYEQPLRRRIMIWIMTSALTIAVSSVQILPATELLKQSLRAHGLDFNFATAYSMNPKRLPEFLFSGFLGQYDSSSPQDYWGEAIEDLKYPLYLSIYVGPLAVLMLFSGVFGRKNDGILTRRLLHLLLALVCGFWILSFGKFLPGFRILFENVPGLNTFRFPSKFSVYAVLPMALLLGHGLHVLWSGAENRKRILTFNWVFLGSVAVFFIIFLSSQACAMFFFGKANPFMNEKLNASMLRACLILSAAVLLLQFGKSSHREAVLLTAILTFDLLQSGGFVNFYVNERFYLETPNVVKTVRSEIGDGRLFRSQDPTNFTLTLPSREIFWKYRWWHEVLSPNLSASYLIPSAFNIDLEGLLSYEISQMTFAAGIAPWNTRIHLLQAAGVNLILTPDEVRSPTTDLYARINNASTAPFFLYKNKNSIGRVTFARNWVFLPNCDQMIPAMLSPNFDASRFVTLKGKTSPVYLNPCKGDYKLRQIKRSIHSSEVELKTDCDGYVVFSESFDAGWKVRIDGSETALTRANCAFSAVYVKSGTHRIEKFYDPDSFQYGVIISIATTFILMAVGVFSKLRRSLFWKGRRSSL